MSKSPTMLIILDGYGESEETEGNAIKTANTPFLDKLRKEHPTIKIDAAGNAVGLPEGIMGASEPGHVTIGAGRIVWQPLEEINRSIRYGEFFKNAALIQAVSHAANEGTALHLLGMISDAGVHSDMQHLFALMEMAKENGIEKLFIHAIGDGRDVEEKSILTYLKQIEDKIQELKIGKIATIVGRFYAMDRDQNYDRTQIAYDLMINGKGTEENDYEKAIQNFYDTEEEKTCTDYYLKPILLDKEGTIKDNDAIIFFNYRSDRARQITHAFCDADFEHFKRSHDPSSICFSCMGPYSHERAVAFPAARVKNNLGETIAKAGLSQLRIAETEKYAHVTFFFNSQIDKPWPNETRILVDSPKVATYADAPEMSAGEITDKVCAEIQKKKHDLIILNFANPDLVGHSGDFDAVVKSLEFLDTCIERIYQEMQKVDGNIILTADHGNAEQMVFPNSGLPCPAHTTNKVLLTIIGKGIDKLKEEGNLGLKDIAPTILDLLDVEKPVEMTGESLRVK